MLDIKTVKLKTEAEIIASWKDKEKIVVSVVCATFNHELYIEDAITGFLMQETDFAFEVIIHDDASTDKTADIVREYQSKYPTIIKPIYQAENQYSKGGFRPTPYATKFSKGEYIAICEGDDFWIDNLKIQKQVMIFIKNKKISLLHTNAFDLFVIENKYLVSNSPAKNNSTLSLFKRNRIRTLTTMFKKSDYVNFYLTNGNEAKNWLLGDWPIWIYLSTIGEIYLLNDITSVYRVLPESLSHSDDHHKINKFRASTYSMRIYMAEKYLPSKLSFQEISKASIKDHILYNTTLVESAYTGASLKYKAFFILNLFVPLKILVKIFLKLKRKF